MPKDRDRVTSADQVRAHQGIFRGALHLYGGLARRLKGFPPAVSGQASLDSPRVAALNNRRLSPSETGSRAHSSAGEHRLHTAGVVGSIPTVPTSFRLVRVLVPTLIARKSVKGRLRGLLGAYLFNLRPDTLKLSLADLLFFRAGRAAAPDLETSCRP